jgi:hypothetical protein
MLSSLSSANTIMDSDFDGVSDRYDECPNTPFSDLVDSRGCSVEKVKISNTINKLTVIIGANYSNYHSEYGNKTKTLSQSLELDYELKKIKLMLYISRFSSDNTPLKQYDESSFADTRLSFLYTLDREIQNLGLSIGGGVAIPNYKGTLHNNGFDFFYSLNANYNINQGSIFASYIFTNIGDHDVAGLKYQNTNAFVVGSGYSITPKLYGNISFYFSDPMVKSDKDIRSFSISSYYNMSQKNFLNISYTHDLTSGINSSDYNFQLGYRM